jgi:hypothetical protein
LLGALILALCVRFTSGEGRHLGTGQLLSGRGVKSVVSARYPGHRAFLAFNELFYKKAKRAHLKSLFWNKHYAPFLEFFIRSRGHGILLGT